MGCARRSTRGQATLEFAIVLPVMLLIALGTVDVGRMFFDYIGIRNAVMEGAIYGANHPSDMAGAKQRVKDHYLPNPVPAGLVVAMPVADANCATVGAPGFVTVTATREFSPLSLAALEFLGPDTDWVFTVQSTAKTRCMT
jgi:Flp pilus assembly protein TadG